MNSFVHKFIYRSFVMHRAAMKRIILLMEDCSLKTQENGRGIKHFSLAFLTVFLLINVTASAQEVSISQTATDGFYYWNTGSNWTDNTAPPTANIGDPLQNAGGNIQIQIEGYISRNGSLSFANIGANTREFVIKDTLVVYGSLSFANNSYSLTMLSGSLLVVLGDFSANNKVTVANGGTIVVDGNMTLSGGQNEYASTGGVLVVTGTITGNGDTPAAIADNELVTDLPTGVQDFLTDGGTTPLPIVLSYFEGKALDDVVKLAWETLSEENFDHFEIQRSHDGREFEVIGTKQGNGFTSEKHQYSFIDNAPKIGMNYYRLNAIDFDGSFEIFETIVVEVKPNFSNVSVYPNPTNGNSFEMQIPEDIFNNFYEVTFSVSDLKGQVITSGEITSAQVSTSFDNQLKTGIYLVTIQTGAYSSTLRLMVN